MDLNKKYGGRGNKFVHAALVVLIFVTSIIHSHTIYTHNIFIS